MKTFEIIYSSLANNEKSKQELLGISNTSYLAMQISLGLKSLAKNQSLLIVVPNREHVSSLLNDFNELKLVKARGLRGSDINPYNSIFPSDLNTADRMGFLAAKWENLYQVYVASLQDLQQWTASKDFFVKHSIRLQAGEDIPQNFFAKLNDLGYRSVDTVEDPLTYANRGGIIDIFSPVYTQAFRVELFDDQIESIKMFDIDSQRSISSHKDLIICPARECLYELSDIESVVHSWRQSCVERGVELSTKTEYLSKLTRRQYFHGMDYLIPHFHADKQSLLSHFADSQIFFYDLESAHSQFEKYIERLQLERLSCSEEEIRPLVSDIYCDELNLDIFSQSYFLNALKIESSDYDKSFRFQIDSINGLLSRENKSHSAEAPVIVEKIKAWQHQDLKVLLAQGTQTQSERTKLILENHNVPFRSFENFELAINFLEQSNENVVAIANFHIQDSFKSVDDKIVVLNSEGFFGKKAPRKSATKTLHSEANKSFSLSDIHPGDRIVHIQHGVGVYQGLSIMQVQGNSSEFIHISYKDGDKLFIPVYKIGLLQKYNGGHEVDRLGTKSWEKAKIKVKAAIKDIADELLRLYAKRSQVHRPAFTLSGDHFDKFEEEFPYIETDDQLNSIQDILADFQKETPMDRLICGDVGFGKTEVAMRAAFLALEQGKQVAILVPTTVLAFQHFENFKKRFKSWPFRIASLSRFTPAKEIKESLLDIKLGRIDIIIGTHRLLSSDLHFAKLGLIIIDEEHRFGVAHKEKLKQLKSNVDCLSLSATPIPRTLNMSLVGIRDLSVINTPPQDRLPTKTFVVRYSESSIKNAIELELKRDGQVYFIHNRVKSIQSRAHELREMFPHARLAVAHGHMKEAELEKIMLNFFSRKIDILLCTAIVENGVDNPFANTMIIDNAHQMGLSQLYQFRGRVGRAKDRAYCYLLIPQNIKLDETAQARLKVIQENTALGSGLKIAHHDLELRGAGSILGSEQSGELNTVGYDLYLELLEQSLKEAKGESYDEESIEPEINLRLPALIPDRYISDIRTRLSYYKAMSEIQSEEDLEKIESELIDQFGKLPPELLNLMGIMMIRRYCKNLGIKDVSAGPVNVSFAFSSKTKINVMKLVDLSLKQSTKYKITPDNRLLIKLPDCSWPQVLQEVKQLEAFL